MKAAPSAFTDFVGWLRSRPGLPPVGQSWARFADDVMRRRDGIEGALLAPTIISDPGDAVDFERWSLKRRLRWNLNALRVLAALRTGAIVDPSLVQRSLRAYTGWGGYQQVLKDLPGGQGLFDAQTERAIAEWRKYERTGERPDRVIQVFQERLDTQYFTPIDVCGVMWQYALQLIQGPVQRVLEPSAGIGRMLDALPVGEVGEVHVDAIEYDASLAEVLSARWANANTHVQVGPFEDFAPKHTYDVVITNPPFTDRSAVLLRKIEPRVTRAEHFALIRGLQLTRPGGVIVALTPASLVTGTGIENMNFRERMHTHGDFRGAVMLPAACFPTVAGQLVVQVWTRRNTPRTVADATVLTRKPYEYPPENVLGQLVDAYRGQRVEGDFDPARAMRVQWLTTDTVAGTAAVEAQEGADDFTEVTTTSRPPATPGAQERPPVVVDNEHHHRVSTASLGMRLAHYYHRVDHQMLTLAEAGRNELLADLAWHIDLWGVPGEAQVAAVTPGARAGWARYVSEGISPTPVVEVEEAPQPGSSPFEAVAHFCRLQGFCSEDNLDRYFPQQSLLVDLIQQGIMLEPDPHGGFLYFTEEHFLTGDISQRLKRLTEYLQEKRETLTDYPEVVSRLDAGAARLEAIIGSTSVLTLGISVRSSIVSQEIRAAWAKFAIHPAADLHYDGALYSVTVTRHNGAKVTLHRFEEYGFHDVDYRRDDHRKKMEAAERDGIVTRAIAVLGYLNRLSQVDVGHPDGKKRNVFAAKMSFMARDAAEKEVEESFTRWISQPEQARSAEQIESVYNDRIHRQGGRLYSTDPVPLARQNANIPLKQHQNQTVRWQMDRAGGFIFDAVGAGKTFAMLASLVLHRQRGTARRFVLAVPVSTLAQWFAQARLFLPDYRIALVGMKTVKDTKTGRMVVREEDQDERAAKWAGFRDGYYDLILVGHQGFLADVYPRADTIEEAMAEQAWLQRGLAKMAAARTRAEKNLTAIYVELGRKLVDADASTPREKLRALCVKAAKDLRAVRTHDGGTLGNIWIEEIIKYEEIISANTPKDIEVMDGTSGDVPAGDYRPKEAANLIAWEDIAGPDVELWVDEAHTYKNLWAPAPRNGQTIAFLGATEKKKTKKNDKSADDDMQLTKLSWDLLFKCSYLAKQRGDGQGIGLATATPYSNSPIELYNLGCYLSPQFWPDNGIEHKEEFIDTFLDIQEVNTASVMTLEGHVGPGVRGFKKPGPLLRLHSILAPVMQRRTKEDLTVAGILDLPKVHREDIVVPMTGMQMRANDAVRAVAEERILRKMRKKNGTASEGEKEDWGWGRENALTLALMSLLSDVALDPRLLVLDYYRSEGVPAAERKFIGTKDPDKESVPSEDLAFVYSHIWDVMRGMGVRMPGDLEITEAPAKFTAIADRLVEDWQGADPSGKTKFGVLVFLDSVEAHEWFIETLVRKGIKRDRIAVISGAVSKPKRDQIALGFNGRDAIYDPVTKELIEDAVTPEYDVLIGNSKAMATGLNLQRRTGAIYHVTFTWEPATIEQREGRGIRQGNTESGIRIYNVMAEKSFDGILVNTSQGKAEWQNEVFPGIAPVTASSSGMDREEALIRWVVRDPEQAKKLFMEIRERQRQENQSRLNLMAWRIWQGAYANMRQAAVNAPRAPQILAGVRYSLENSPRAAMDRFPAGVVDALLDGRPVFPDFTTGIAIYYGGNRMTRTDGSTVDIVVIQGNVTERVITLYHRARGDINVTRTTLYKPGGSAGGVQAAFPDVVSSVPIPWSRKEEVSAVTAAPEDLAVGCLFTDTHDPRFDRLLCIRAWGAIQDDPAQQFGEVIRPFHTPEFASTLQNVGQILLTQRPVFAQYGYGIHIFVPFIMENGDVAMMAPGYQGNTTKTEPTKAMKIRRMLTPMERADGELFEQAAVGGRLYIVTWQGERVRAVFTGSPETVKSQVISFLWTLNSLWDRISEANYATLMSMALVANSGVTADYIVKQIGYNAVPASVLRAAKKGAKGNTVVGATA